MSRKTTEIKSWVVPVRYTLRGVIIVDAKTKIEAMSMCGEVDMENGGELVDWEVVGEVRENT